MNDFKAIEKAMKSIRGAVANLQVHLYDKVENLNNAFSDSIDVLPETRKVDNLIDKFEHCVEVLTGLSCEVGEAWNQLSLVVESLDEHIQELKKSKKQRNSA